MTGGRLPLARQVLVLTVGLVAVTTVVAVLAVAGLAQHAARSEQERALSAQADLLVQQSQPARQAAVDRAARRLGGSTIVTVVAADGTVRVSSAKGRSAPVTAAVRDAGQRAAQGEAVSTQVQVGRKVTLVEARPTDRGDGLVVTRRLARLTTTSRDLLLGTVVTLAVCLLLAAVAAWWLSRRVTRPLAATAEAARRLAAGERGVAVPATSPAEVADVAAALVRLDDALTGSEARQHEFLLSVSHELRTPVTALRGYGEALADGMVPPSDVPGVGRTLVAETVRLDGFVGDLLELARLEADDFSVVAAPVPLGTVARAAVEAWRGRAATAQVALDVVEPDTWGAGSPGSETGEPVALADPQRVRQVVDGLIENALRATPSGGRVAVLVGPPASAPAPVVAGASTAPSDESRRAAGAAATDGRGTVGLAVEDSGPGLDDADLAVALDRGALHRRYAGRRPVGTGLGLSIAARLAVRMGGRVVAGPATGLGGARFTVVLPAAETPHPRPPAPPAPPNPPLAPARPA